MKVKLTKNIGSDDLRKFGMLTGSEPADLRKALDTYSKDRIVDVPEHFHEYLIKHGLAEATDEPLSPDRPLRGVAKAPAITAPTPSTMRENPHEPAPKKDK